MRLHTVSKNVAIIAVADISYYCENVITYVTRHEKIGLMCT